MVYILFTYLLSPFLSAVIFLISEKNVKKILIIQTAKIGDLICSTPVFREVKKKYPDAHLSIITNPVNKELLEYNPHVNEILSIKNEDYKGLSGKIRLSNLIRKGHYDVAICLNPNVPFALALFWGLVPIRLSVLPNFTGNTFKLASVFYTCLEKHNSGQLVIETYLKMLRAIGIESNDISKEVYKSTDADRKAEEVLGDIDSPLIGIAVSSGNKLKELGAEKVAALISMLLDEMTAHIVLIGSDQDKSVARIISEMVIRKDKVSDATGKLSLKELPALIERLSLFIGVDTGITYMADALSIPLVSIAGPADMGDQRPTGKNVVIFEKKGIPCVPCSHTFKAPYACRSNTRDCINMIKEEDIVIAAKNFINQQTVS